MLKKIVSGIMLTSLLIGMLSLTLNIRQVKGEEPALISILYTLGFTNIAESTIEIFQPRIYEVTLYAEFAASHALNELSWYKIGTSEYNLLFAGEKGNYGYISPPIVETFVVDGEFGLSFLSPDARYFTETTRNPDGIKHAMIFANLDNPAMFLLGFEDVLGGGDRDYQDMVVSLELVTPPPEYSLAIDSSPTGVTFTVDGVSHTTPWSGTYVKGDRVYPEMPEMYSVGEARYYWSQWSDGVTSRSRKVTMDTNITLTAYYDGPYHELTVVSSPITGVTFTINGVPKTTPYTEWLLAGPYTLEMPNGYNGHKWSHWLEDGDTNRIKTIILSGTMWTGVFVPVPPPPKPVGGYSSPAEVYTTANPSIPYLALIAIIISGFAITKRKILRKRR